jgi:hypothetical protein
LILLICSVLQPKISIFLLLISNSFDKKLINSLFAFQFSGTAFILIFKVPSSRTLKNSDLLAFGVTFILSNQILFSNFIWFFKNIFLYII